MEPESKPVLDPEHGELKSPETAVWMLPTKWNSSVSPTSAVTLSGEKTKPPEPAVMTTVFAAAVAASATMALNEGYIFLRGCFELGGSQVE
jgi:hypothetical protein